MLFERIDETIVPIETEVSQIGAMRIFLDTPFYITRKRLQVAWKKVATVDILFTCRRLSFSCAGVFAESRRIVLVVVVTLAVFYKSEQQIL